MAIGRNHLTQGSSTNNVTSYTTASITPTANALVVLSIHCTAGTGTPPNPTVTGNGLTWVLVDRTTAGGVRESMIYRAMGTSPTAGTVAINFGAKTMSGCNWSITQYTGADTSGTSGSGAIVQTYTANAAAATSISRTFGGTVVAGNATHAAVGFVAQETATPGTGWTSMSSTFVGTPANALLSMSALTPQQTIAASWTTSAASFLAAIEIKAASGGGGTNLNRLRIGDSTPAAIRIGDSTVNKVYVGDTQVWP